MEARVCCHATGNGPTGSQIYGHAGTFVGRKGGSRVARLQEKGREQVATRDEPCAGREAMRDSRPPARRAGGGRSGRRISGESTTRAARLDGMVPDLQSIFHFRSLSVLFVPNQPRENRIEPLHSI
jgi:hypothetical protein